MSSPFTWHGSWRRLVPGENLGVAEAIQFGLNSHRSPSGGKASAVSQPSRSARLTVAPISMDVPGLPATRRCGRMWLGG